MTLLEKKDKNCYVGMTLYIYISSAYIIHASLPKNYAIEFHNNHIIYFKKAQITYSVN